MRFETQNSPGTPLRSDNYEGSQYLSLRQQTGNSWWDYEPIGFIDPMSTQTLDSDNGHYSVNNSKVYERSSGGRI